MDEQALWYKDAIIYQLHVKAFFDANDDGMGDFAGLTEKLDYIQNLGATAVWLLPFYPSPLRDDGYDIADYRSVNPAYGTMRDFRRFVREAHRRGLRVITELVVNHTSDQHPWFDRARRAKPGSTWRDFYVWSDTDQKYPETRIIFTDTEKSNWSWDPVAQAYYWHRFFHHQPDLNFDNPRVLEGIVKAMRFWLDAGVDGLRLDAIPYLCEREGTNNENLPETHEVIRKIRRALDETHEHRMLLAEANQWPEDVRPYFGEGDECHMAFHFPLMPRMYMAIAQEDRHPITDIMRQTPRIPDTCQWAIFLRNHDELTLEMVTDRERDYLWDFYAADRRMRINLGIRRRLAPLVENDRLKIQLLNSLLMSMPGTPVIYYGDEIGMGDNVFLGDRNGVRTPMQWSPDRNGGFSRADPAHLFLPAIMDPVYGYEAVNVEAQSRSPSSLLNWMRRLVAVRKSHPAFGRGSIRFVYPGNRKILVYLREHEGEAILCLANLCRAPQAVELNLGEFEGRVPVELVGRSSFPPIGQLPYFITLPGYGFYWFLLAKETEAPAWHEPFLVAQPEFQTLVAPEGWRSISSASAGEALQREVLPAFLTSQRWFGAKDVGIAVVELDEAVELSGGEAGWLVATWRLRLTDESEQRYFLPLSIAWETSHDDPLAPRMPHALARVRKGARVGGLYDALADPDFVRSALSLMRENREVPTASGGRLSFTSTGAMTSAEVPGPELSVTFLGKEQSNTSLRLGEGMIFKALRRVQPGIHPEVEVGRFLTEAGYRNTPPLLGVMEMLDDRGVPTTLALVQGFVANQGDGWSYTTDYLARYLEEAGVRAEPTGTEEDPHAVYAQMARTLGRRTAELHRAFAGETEDPAFRAEPVTGDDLAGWADGVAAQAEAARQALAEFRGECPEELAEEIEDLLEGWPGVRDRIRTLLPDAPSASKTRYHGDYHLGQVIVVQSDFYVLDFEGEPAKSLAHRRAKHSPLRDVAGMLRSFSYAAWAALFAATEERPEAIETLLPSARQWETRAIAAFMEGYGEAVGDCPSYPDDPRIARDLTDLFALEKAMYEVCYEAANRPKWLRIPLQGIRGLLEGR